MERGGRGWGRKVREEKGGQRGRKGGERRGGGGGGGGVRKGKREEGKGEEWIRERGG